VRAPGDILLVSLYELGRQPLGVAGAAAFLTRAGFAPACADLAVAPLDPEAVARARLVALSVPMHTAVRLGVEAVRKIRAWNPAAHLCCYGLYATLGEATLRAAGVHTLLGGEAEEALCDLAVALEAGRPPAASAGPTLRRLPFLPPDRSGLPAATSYARLIVGEERRIAGAVEATRGCRHLCRHCPIPAVYQGRFFAVPEQVVASDAAQQIAAGVRHLTFADADFFNAPKHALAVARRVHALDPDVTFDATIKVEHILRHRELVPPLAELGMVFVVSAFESLSDHVLHILDKGHTGADCAEALRVVRDAGISLRPTFLPFTPWTSLEDYLAMCHFLVAYDLLDEVDPVQLSLRLLVPPGSLLLSHPEMRPHLGALDEPGFTHRWTHPDPRMDALQARVAALVEDAAEAGAAATDTFEGIHALAAGAAGRIALDRRAARPPRRSPPPRLSEPWFC
jgi:radical SAM superfamily enzyme YgiQ (UPF0313 family)